MARICFMKLSQKEKILFILGDYEWHSRSEFIYTHFLPKHDSRISELISSGKAQIEKKMDKTYYGRFEMHYKLKRKDSVQSSFLISQTFNN